MKKLILLLVFAVAACTSDPLTLPSGGQIEGNWMGDCNVGLSNAEWQQLAVSHESAGLLNLKMWFGATSCTGVSNVTMEVLLNLTMVGIQNLSDGTEASRVDQTALQHTATPNDQATADKFNMAGIFGITSWTVGQPQDITGLDNATGAYTAPVIEKVSVRIDEIVIPNELFGPDQLSPLDADGYPTVVSTVRDFYRN